MDEALFYAETVAKVGVDPLSGDTETDRILRESSQRLAEMQKALKELSTKDWAKISAAPARAPQQQKRKAARHG